MANIKAEIPFLIAPTLFNSFNTVWGGRESEKRRGVLTPSEKLLGLPRAELLSALAWEPFKIALLQLFELLHFPYFDSRFSYSRSHRKHGVAPS